MQVNEHLIRQTLPIQTTELNIHFGVFIGGLGDFSESYLTNVVNYRGCISDVYYNNINVFKRARDRTSHVTSMKVSWNCAAEFDAGVQESISFIEDDAYMMLSKPVQKLGERLVIRIYSIYNSIILIPTLFPHSWTLELRTIEHFGAILYNTGVSSRSDFMSLEIVESKLRLLVGKGANAVELIPDRNVSDGKWHNISVTYSPMTVEVGSIIFIYF